MLLEYALEMLTEVILFFFLFAFIAGFIKETIPHTKLGYLLSGHSMLYCFIGSIFGLTIPFCSCCSLSLFAGLLKAGTRVGPAMSFLLAAPLINPISIMMLSSGFGKKITLIYVIVILILTTISGYLIAFFGFEKYLIRESLINNKQKHALVAYESKPYHSLTTLLRHSLIGAWEIITGFGLYIIFGVALSIALYSILPEELPSFLVNGSKTMLIPLAALTGLPMQLRPEVIVPTMVTFASKGAATSVVFALATGSVATSVPALIIAKRMMRWQLRLTMVLVVFLSANIVGIVVSLL
jgi:hypothetical protein